MPYVHFFRSKSITAVHETWLQRLVLIMRLAAACTTRSPTVGIPRGLCVPSAFGIYTRLTGFGRYVLSLQCTAGALLDCAPTLIQMP